MCKLLPQQPICAKYDIHAQIHTYRFSSFSPIDQSYGSMIISLQIHKPPTLRFVLPSSTIRSVDSSPLLYLRLFLSQKKITLSNQCLASLGFPPIESHYFPLLHLFPDTQLLLAYHWFTVTLTSPTILIVARSIMTIVRVFQLILIFRQSRIPPSRLNSKPTMCIRTTVFRT